MKKTDHDFKTARDYHDTDVRVRPIVFFVVLTAAFTVLTFIGLAYAYRAMHTRPPESPVTRFVDVDTLPPEPRIQVAERRALVEYQAVENARLQGYGWVDQQAGVVHIPIERAITLTAERGLPVRANAASEQR